MDELFRASIIIKNQDFSHGACHAHTLEAVASMIWRPIECRHPDIKANTTVAERIMQDGYY
jgi:hypothetical protein